MSLLESHFEFSKSNQLQAYILYLLRILSIRAMCCMEKCCLGNLCPIQAICVW